MLLMRIRVFYAPNSGLYRVMLVIGVLFWILNTAGDVFGIMTAIELWNNKILKNDFSVWFFYSRACLVVGFCLEAAFTTLGSIGFLYAISKGSHLSKQQILFKLIFQQDGLNLFTIVFINFLIAVMGIHSLVFGFAWYTRICLFLPSWSYGLQFSTFLKDSYVSARKIVEENSSRLNGSSSFARRNDSETM